MSENETLNEEPIIADTKSETDKKCSACGGIMDFDPNTGELLCSYCGYKEEIQVDESKLKAEELELDSAEETGNCNWGVETKTVICKSCGGETVYDALQTASECPYCGSNQVMEANDTNTLAPGGVCVFKLDKKRAGSNFKTWINKKWFCPKAAKQKAKPDSFKGVYLPYWTFDSDTVSDYTAKYGKNRTVKTRDGKTKVVTDWYNTRGTYSEKINDHLVKATTKHDANLMSKIEPFDTENNVAYKPEYLAGYASERYSTGLKSAWGIAKENIKDYLGGKIRSKVIRDNHADKVSNLRFGTKFKNVTYKYLMLPIYISSFKYKDKVYQFMVNGQTGKVGGKTPISALRVLVAIGIGLAIFAGIVLFVYYTS